MLPEAIEDHTWQKNSACIFIPNASEIFFSDEPAQIAEAKNICATCNVLAQCLEGAIRRSEPCGIWGGQIFFNGEILPFKRKRGRPSKKADPAKELPLVPIPKHLLKLIA